MSLTLTLFQRDVFSCPRRRWFYLKRAGFVLAGAIVILWGLSVSTMTRTTTAGLQIFRSLSNSVLFMTCVLSALTAGLNVIREKTDRTIGLLFLTDISSRQQVIGRLLTSVFLMIITVLSVFPMFVLSAALGGVSPVQIASAFAVLLGSIFLGCCIGLFASAFTRTERSMVTLEIFISIAVFVALPIIVGISYELAKKPLGDILRIISSFVAMHSLGRGTGLVFGVWNSFFNIALGLPFLLVACIALPRRVVSEANASWSRTLKEKVRSTRRGRKWFAKPRITGNPIVWKDQHFTHRGYKKEWMIAGLLTMPAIGITVYLITQSTRAGSQVAAYAVLGAISSGAAIVFGLVTVMRAARAFNTEKQGRTMELLLTTGLTDKEIIRGKGLAIFLSSLPWLLFAVGGSLLLALVSGEPIALLIAAGYGIYLSATVFAFACLAMLLSLRFKTPAVIGISFLVFVVWNWIVKTLISVPLLFFFRMMGGPLALAVSHGVIDVALGWICLRLLRRNFRWKALKEI